MTMTTTPEPRTPTVATSRRDAIMSVVDGITVDIVDSFTALHRHVDDLQGLLTDSADHIKSELEAHVEITEVVAAESRRLTDLAEDLRRRKTGETKQTRRNGRG